MLSIIRTSVSDSITSNVFTVSNILLGGNVTASFKNNKNFTTKPINLIISGQTFWVNCLSNAINSDLNFQYQNRNDYLTQQNKTKKLTSNPYPYYKADFLAQFCLSNDTTNNKPNNVFVHLAFTSNLLNANPRNLFFNNYFVAQVGIAINITQAVQKITQK